MSPRRPFDDSRYTQRTNVGTRAYNTRSKSSCAYAQICLFCNWVTFGYSLDTIGNNMNILIHTLITLLLFVTIRLPLSIITYTIKTMYTIISYNWYLVAALGLAACGVQYL
jgi:hypothetical protein